MMKRGRSAWRMAWMPCGAATAKKQIDLRACMVCQVLQRRMNPCKPAPAGILHAAMYQNRQASAAGAAIWKILGRNNITPWSARI